MWGTATCGSSKEGERTTCATARMPGRLRLWTMVMLLLVRFLRWLLCAPVAAGDGRRLLLLLLLRLLCGGAYVWMREQC